MGRRGLPRFGLAALAVLAAAVVALAMLARDDGLTEQPRGEAPPEIEAQATLTPRPVLFGDTVRASVDVMLDTERIDPRSVRVAADFTPWEVVGRPERRIASTYEQAHVRTTFVLRCLTGACVPAGQSALYEFPQGRVSFIRRGDRFDESSIPVRLPGVRVYSRLTDVVPVDDSRPSVPWQVDLLSLPAPSLRVAPSTLVLLLLLGALAATAGAVALAYAAWPRALAPPPAPAPMPPPGPALSPLEQALVLLENAVRVDGAADQRRALELVAEELERAAWGDPKLAQAARALAWSEGVPPVNQTTELAARVRSVLDETHETHRNGDSHAP
jgi:hypothetical protein